MLLLKAVDRKLPGPVSFCQLPSVLRVPWLAGCVTQPLPLPSHGVLLVCLSSHVTFSPLPIWICLLD